jgi:hypothetical protein
MRNVRTRAADTISSGTEARRTTMSTGGRSSRGFGANKMRNANDRTFRVEDETKIIAFLEEENFSFAGRHWVDIIDPETNKVRKTVKNCLGVLNTDDPDEYATFCPLCAAGDNPKATYFFNVADLEDPMKVRVWEATTDPANKVEKRYQARAKNGQHLNDEGIYWAISKEQQGAKAGGKGGGAWSYSVDPVKERDMPEDWPSFQPLSPERREVLLGKLYDESYVKYDTFEDLEGIVDIRA